MSINWDTHHRVSPSIDSLRMNQRQGPVTRLPTAQPMQIPFPVYVGGINIVLSGTINDPR
ncbi:hypothetical protein RUM43_006602, partial [Polyplax serrata]